MDELVGAFQALDELLTNGLPEIRVDAPRRCPENKRKRPDFGAVAETGELLQSLLRVGAAGGSTSHHQVHHVVGVTLGVNAIEIPGPARSVMIED